MIEKYAHKNYRKMFREPEGQLNHKFIVPGSTYSNQLWDWDCWLTNVALRQFVKMYVVKPSGNPSCWLGPIWGISNYMVFKGLVKYGFYDEAKELAEKTINLLEQDLEKSGDIHEYYDPESGAPMINPGFQNWNLLSINMKAWLNGEPVVEEF